MAFMLKMIWVAIFVLLIRLSFSQPGKETSVEFEFDTSMSVLTLRKPGMNAGADWTILLQ